MKTPISISYYISCSLMILIILAAVFGHFLMPHGITDPYKITLWKQEMDGQMRQFAPPLAPNSTFWLGTDHRGFDIASLLLNGLKYTLAISLLATLLRFAIALPLGFWSGTTGRGKGLLSAMQWMTTAVPAFLFLFPPLSGMSYMLDSFDFAVVFLFMVTLIGVFPLAYQLSERARYYNDQLYVDVSRLMGGSNRHRIVRHILPNMRLELAFTILSEFAQVLFLIGQLAIFKIMLGGSEPYKIDEGYQIFITYTGEWTALFAYGTAYIRQYPWIILSAGGCLSFLLLSVHFFLTQLKKRYGMEL